MIHWIISANANIYDHSSSFEHFSFIDWRQGRGKFKVGDIIFIYSTYPIQMIQYKCSVVKIDIPFADIRDDEQYWKDKEEYKKSLSGLYMRLNLIDQTNSEKLNLSNLKIAGLGGPPQGPVKVKIELLEYINSNFSDRFQTEIFPEMLNEDVEVYEGAKKLLLVNKYERSIEARTKCIAYHGHICKVCGLDFVKRYGEIGKGFIHVHHLIPIHKIGKEYSIDFVKDLIPVCPNCHSMLHRKINGKEPTIEELKGMIRMD